MWKLHAAGHITLMLKAYDKPQLFLYEWEIGKAVGRVSVFRHLNSPNLM